MTQLAKWFEESALITSDSVKNTISLTTNSSLRTLKREQNEGEWEIFDRVRDACSHVESFLGSMSESKAVFATYFVEIDEQDFVDVDAHLNKIESTKAGQAGMAEARKWVARALYSDERSLRAFRLQRGLSQKKLAELIGTNQSMVCRWEQGNANLEALTICKLAKALEVDSCEIWKLAEAMALKGVR